MEKLNTKDNALLWWESVFLVQKVKITKKYFPTKKVSQLTIINITYIWVSKGKPDSLNNEF